MIRPKGTTRNILRLAWPVLIGQIASIAYSVADTIMTGHASAIELAAMSVGIAVYSSVLIGLAGVIMALNPIAAHHYGARRLDQAGAAFVQGLWLALILGVIGAASFAMPDLWLSMSDVSEPVRAQFHGYLHALGLALPAALLFRTVYAMSTAISRPRVVMAINLAGLTLKLPLNWIFVYGHLGVPALGTSGCGVATAIVMWCSFACAIVLVAFDRGYAPYKIRFARPDPAILRELLRMGIPTGATYLIEVTSFTFMALLAARLGPVVSGAHQITASVTSIMFMVPLALSIATATIAAQALGAGDPTTARRVARTGRAMAVSVSTLMAVIMASLAPQVGALFTDDLRVADFAVTLLKVAAIYHVFDATQTMAAFTLRAYRHTVTPLAVHGTALWGLGLVGGFYVAFEPPFGITPCGAVGLWTSATVAITLAALVLTVASERAMRAADDQDAMRRKFSR